MNKYEQGKVRAQQLAQQWQQDQSPKSWGEIAEKCAQFEKLATRYGLRREFKENGII